MTLPDNMPQSRQLSLRSSCVDVQKAPCRLQFCRGILVYWVGKKYDPHEYPEKMQKVL